MTTQPSISGYRYETWTQNCSHSYLLPELKRELLKAAAAAGEPKLAFDLGCGNGSIAAAIAATYKNKFALVVGVFFLMGGVSMVYMVPAPTWFAVLDLVVAYIPMAIFGGKIGMKIKL